MKLKHTIRLFSFAMSMTLFKVSAQELVDSNGYYIQKVDEEAAKLEGERGYAIFPGGRDGLNRYINQYFIMPKDCKIVSLHFVISFDVDSAGTAKNAKLIVNDNKCDSFDKVAVKLIDNMPKWTPEFTGDVNNRKISITHLGLTINYIKDKFEGSLW